MRVRIAKPSTALPKRAREVPTNVQSRPKSRRVTRVLQLMRALQTGQPGTPDELACLFGVSRRTLFRDLEVLAEAGMSCTYDGSTGRYSIHLD